MKQTFKKFSRVHIAMTYGIEYDCILTKRITIPTTEPYIDILHVNSRYGGGSIPVSDIKTIKAANP